MTNKKYYTLRWIAVFPAALVGFFVAHLFIDLLYGFSGYANRGSNFADLATEYGIPIISSILAGMAFILIGINVAPSHKRNTAIILLVVLASLSGIGIFTSLTFRYYFSTITSVTQLIGGLAAYFQMEHDKKFEIDLKKDSSSVTDSTKEDDDEEYHDYEKRLMDERNPHFPFISRLAEQIKAHPIGKHLPEKRVWKAAIAIYRKKRVEAVKKSFFEKYAKIPDESLFPSKEQAQKIALSKIGENASFIEITDEERKLKNAYNPPPGCWYVIYIDGASSYTTNSTSYIAISKVDGSIIAKGSLNDEG